MSIISLLWIFQSHFRGFCIIGRWERQSAVDQEGLEESKSGFWLISWDHMACTSDGNKSQSLVGLSESTDLVIDCPSSPAFSDGEVQVVDPVEGISERNNGVSVTGHNPDGDVGVVHEVGVGVKGTIWIGFVFLEDGVVAVIPLHGWDMELLLNGGVVQEQPGAVGGNAWRVAAELVPRSSFLNSHVTGGWVSL